MKRSLEAGVVAALILTAMVTAVRSSLTESQAFDEGVHLASGVSYWVTGDFRMNPEHPPLAKLLAGAAALTLRPTVPLNDPSWSAPDEWAFARAFLYHNRVSADALLLAGRLPTVLAFGGLLALLFYIIRRAAGDTAGFVTLAFASVDPNLLAFSRYVLTDMLFTLGFVATLFTFWRYLERRTVRRLLTFGVVLGLTMATKFSALALAPILVLLGLLWRAEHRTGRRPFRAVVWDTIPVIGIVVLTVWLAYGFQAPRVFDDSRVKLLYNERVNVVRFYGFTDRSPFSTFLTLTADGTGRERFIRTVLERVPIPAYPFFRGVSFVWFHDLLGHNYNYLFGVTSRAGWPYYFPIVLLLKTPLVLLLLAAAGLVAAARAWRRTRSNIGTAFFWLPPLLFLAFTIPSRYNIGLHHVLPSYLAFPVLAGFLAKRSRVWLAAVVLGIGLVALSGHSVAPSYLAYANELAGGPTDLPRYLLGGNLDFGQDLKGLARTVPTGTEVALAYHGQADPTAYGIRATTLPTDDDLGAGAILPTGLAAISVTKLFDDGQHYTWFRGREPIARIGYTIYLYDLRP